MWICAIRQWENIKVDMWILQKWYFLPVHRANVSFFFSAYNRASVIVLIPDL